MYIKSEVEQVRENIDMFCDDLQEIVDDIKYELGYGGKGEKSAHSMAFELENKKIRFMDGSEHEKLNYVERLEYATKELKDIIETLKDLWSDCYL